MNWFAECNYGFIYNGECLDHCPVKTYKAYGNVCAECHYTCHQCNGPYDYQCTSCWGDAELTYTMGQTYCYSKNITSLLQDRTWHTVSTILLIINIFILLIFCKGGFWTINNRGTNDIHYKLANQMDGDDCWWWWWTNFQKHLKIQF